MVVEAQVLLVVLPSEVSDQHTRMSYRVCLLHWSLFLFLQYALLTKVEVALRALELNLNFFLVVLTEEVVRFRELFPNDKSLDDLCS